MDMWSPKQEGFYYLLQVGGYMPVIECKNSCPCKHVI